MSPIFLTILAWKEEVLGRKSPLAGCAIGLIVVFTAAGCISSDRYPENWPVRVTDDTECPDISGVYENIGLGSGDILFCRGCPDSVDYRQCADKCTDHVVQLSEIFFDSTLAYEGNIRIDVPNEGSIEVEIDSQDVGNDVRLLVRNDGDFECSDGRLKLTLDRDLEVDLGGIAFSSRQLNLVKAIDGSLIGEFRYKGKGVIFVAIPAGWSEKHFIRWPTGPE